MSLKNSKNIWILGYKKNYTDHLFKQEAAILAKIGGIFELENTATWKMKVEFLLFIY